MTRLIILDRDGVINEDSDEYIKSPQEWIPIPKSLEAIALLNKAGFTISVASNQSGLARGYYSTETLQQIDQKMHDSLKAVGGIIDSVFYCPHGPNDNCDCRKPKPGLLNQIAAHYQISLENIPFVGDSLRDLQAANAVGATPILVRTGKGVKTFEKNQDLLKDVRVYDSLFSYAKTLIN
jgi:D-glycero-D-manno-heptose 1,7-bisphosphate phosphatase